MFSRVRDAAMYYVFENDVRNTHSHACIDDFERLANSPLLRIGVSTQPVVEK